MEEAAEWSQVADGWAELWGTAARPAWRAVVAATGVGPGTRVLDVGCGTGDFLAHVAGLGAVAAGVDPASGMVRVARARVPGADVRRGWAHDLPWPAHGVDVVTAFNVLHLVEDPRAALAEARRVAVPGGFVAVAGWSDGARHDLDLLQAALATADGEDPAPHDPLRRPGAVERLLAAAGLSVTRSGAVEVVWSAADDATLVRGVLLGEDAAGLASLGPAVVAAARPFRTDAGGYRLVDTFGWAVARTPGRSPAGGSLEAPPPARAGTVR